MKHLITGVAGFIGSNLAKELIKQGEEVIGIDCFTDYYARSLKEKNVRNLRHNSKFTLIEEDLLKVDLTNLLTGVDYIYHQAAQAGVRASWGETFEIYTNNNILATQRLLEAVKDYSIKKFVYASSSSVYGDTEKLPMQENNYLQPVSPYGVSKLAAEHLCYLYWKNFQIPTVSLRYFTVYGEGQRPDMAFHIFIKGILTNKPIKIFGDGKQSRNFTHVQDIVKANLLAATEPVTGKVFNIGGDGKRIKLLDTVKMMEKFIGKKAELVFESRAKGDVQHTSADISRARKLLGYEPVIGFEEGIEREIDWLKEIYL